MCRKFQPEIMTVHRNARVEKMPVGENASVERMPVGENASVENVILFTCPELFWANRSGPICLFNLNNFGKNS